MNVSKKVACANSDLVGTVLRMTLLALLTPEQNLTHHFAYTSALLFVERLC